MHYVMQILAYTLITIEFLNSLEVGGGIPPHALHLCKDAPIMLLRNLDAKHGLCNETWLICKELNHKVIEADITNDSHARDRVFMPRINIIIGLSKGFPFEIGQRQFPIKLVFEMTINKSQGQTIKVLGLYLATLVFNHRQLYVVLS